LIDAIIFHHHFNAALPPYPFNKEGGEVVQRYLAIQRLPLLRLLKSSSNPLDKPFRFSYDSLAEIGLFPLGKRGALPGRYLKSNQISDDDKESVMIWHSIFLMTLIDFVVIFLTFLALWDFYRNRQLLKKLRVFSGLALVVGGLFTIASLYFIDVVSMHFFPLIMPMEKTMKFMENLHLNYNWIITTSGIALLVISVLFLNRVIFPKIMKLEHELETLASTDSLTNIYNRSKYEEIIAREIERANRYNRFLSMIIFDIDFFKKINDNYGHLVGDQVLKTLVSLTKKQMRGTDYLIRWGGDEFILILPETNLEGAKGFAERIRDLTARHKFDDIETLTVSLGVTHFCRGDMEHILFKRVDEALYKAKISGGNRVEVII
jgi:diguanylate cyclase (GGDEF)-like protein